MAEKAFRNGNSRPIQLHRGVEQPTLDIFMVSLFAVAFSSVVLVIELIVFTAHVWIQAEHATLDKIIAWSVVAWIVLLITIFVQLFDDSDTFYPGP